MNLRFLFTFASVLLTPWIAAAGQPNAEPTFTLTTTKGRSYVKAKVLSKEPDGLRISHQDGVAKIPYELLTEELRSKYRFEPERAAAFRDSQAKEALKLEAAVSRDEFAAENEREESAYRLFRARIRSAIGTGSYEYGRLDSTLAEWIEVYTQAGRKEWVAELEADRELLRQKEAGRPAEEAARLSEQLAKENAQLQSQINQLQSAVKSAQVRQSYPTQRTTIYSSPDYYSVPYWHRYYQTIFIRPPCAPPPPTCKPQPPVCPPRPVPMPQPRASALTPSSSRLRAGPLQTSAGH